MSLLDTKEGREALLVQLRCLVAKPEEFLHASAESWDALDRGDAEAQAKTACTFKVAFDALTDPAKLAELAAFECKRHGLRVERHDTLDVFGRVWPRIWVDDGKGLPLMICCDMPTMRGKLSKSLSLPDGSREDVERVLRGET
jgi:hypothetical protein